MRIWRFLKRTVAVILLLVLAIVGYVIFDNSRVIDTEYIYRSSKVPENFDGYRITFLTDFHNADNYEKVAQTIRESSPDIICICGDLVSMNTKDFTNTKKLLRELTSITTVYYTYGNHEMWSKTYNKTEQPPVYNAVSHLGVVMLNDKVKTIEKNGQSINLIGFGDAVYDDQDGLFEPYAKEKLTALSNKLDKNNLSVLLFHRAQYFDMVSQLPYDLVLSGHLHGGHINIKYIREKILKEHFGTTKYRIGEYEQNGHKMIVCGGTALKDDFYRIFNTPEVITVELKTK